MENKSGSGEPCPRGVGVRGVNAKQKNKDMKGKAKLSVIHDIWKSNKSARDMRHFEGKSRIGTLSVGRRGGVSLLGKIIIYFFHV